MNAFSSALALVLASTAAAHSVQDVTLVAEVMSSPKVSTLMVAYNANPSDDDIPCMDELGAFFECLGMECITCVVGLFEDMTEDTTCAEIEASSFCEDFSACITGDCSANDCSAEGAALEACAEENAEEGATSEDEKCPGLCETQEALALAVLKEPVVVPMPTLVAEVMSSPKIFTLMVAYNANPSDDDIPCMADLGAFFECLGMECITCVVSLFEDMTEDTTCAEIEASSFCEDFSACITGDCSANDCSAEGAVLEMCAEENAEEGATSEDEKCSGLCETREALAIA